MKAFSSMFSQLLQLFSRAEFASLVKQHKAERHARGFDCWTQFVAMLFCHLGRATSLREICGGLASVEGRLNHLGVRAAPKRATLAYANKHRPAALYEGVFRFMLARCQALAPRRKFRFKNKLISLDATIIDLCVEMFDWAKFRRTKGGIKVHVTLDHDGYLPSFGVITDAKVHEIRVARTLRFQPGTILAMDRGYVDYLWLDDLEQQGVFFVTRLKDNAVYHVEDVFSGPLGVICSDELIRLPGSGKCLNEGRILRRVVVWDENAQRQIVLLTNQMSLAATTVAAIYKERWQIELFFKALKQNLRIKTFVGTSRNAVETQIWTALVAMLVLKYLQMKSQLSWSLSNLVAMLRFNLFVHRDLWAWLENPFEPPPIDPEIGQTEFAFP